MQQRSKTIRLIRLAMAATVLLPCALFAFASWTAYRNLHVLADERLLRSLDVLQEEAAKTFELTNLTMSNASDLVAGISGGDIRQDGVGRDSRDQWCTEAQASIPTRQGDSFWKNVRT